ncbi:MAG: O-antigen ligase family protein [Nitrospinales bacterium]
MFYKYVIAAAVLLSPWIFSMPMEGDWSRQVKEKAVVGILALLLVYGIWFYNKSYACLLAYLDLFSVFRDNDVSFAALIPVLAFSGLYLFIQWAEDDFHWLKKAVALSFCVVLGYGALQYFHLHPILSVVNAAIRYDSARYVKQYTDELIRAGKLEEGEHAVPGNNYLKKITYRKVGDRMDVAMDLQLPEVVPHLRVNGVFGNPNDWMSFVLVGFPFVFFFLNKKRALVAGVVMTAVLAAVIAEKYSPAAGRGVNREAGPIQSIKIRKIIYAEILEQYKTHWLLGHGLGTFKEQFPRQQKMKTYGVFTYAHNDFLQFLYEAGLVGMILLVGAVAIPLGNLKPLNREKWILLCSLLLFGGSATVNFPAHIAPTMLVGLIAFSLLSRCAVPGFPAKPRPAGASGEGGQST